ncbi:MAG: M23 family metallopeptidase, partial [Propionibacteriaceae bacterium]|nr:M23 family metallopeptidase [Propionibacteriaceae bacterium]
GHPCPLEACLHWGLQEGDTYLDPLTLLVGNPIRLIGAASFEATQERAAQLRALGLDGRVSAAGLISPVTGVITSEYGMRVHPLSGAWRFHDGLDIGAPCGAPLVAMASGVVVELRYHPSYGNRLGIDHGLVLGHSLVSSYSHATGYIVRIGQVVVQGELVGYVGTTGDSTGCHLHLETTVDGVSYDPALLIP